MDGGGNCDGQLLEDRLLLWLVYLDHSTKFDGLDLEWTKEVFRSCVYVSKLLALTITGRICSQLSL